MFRLSLKIGLLFIAIIVVLMASSLLLKDVENILLRRAIPYALVIVIVAIIFWKNVTVVSLKLTNTINNKVIVIPAMLLLFVFTAWASEGFATQTNSTKFAFGIVVLILIQTFWEELIFRGIFLNHYLKNGNGIIRSLLYSSLIFGVVHLINIANNPSVISVINQVVFSVMIGIFMGSLYLLSRNIYLTGFAHALVNYPSYANKYQNDTFLAPDISQEIAQNASLGETILGSFFLLLAYSPFLFVAIAFIKKIKQDVANTPLTPFTEYAFWPFKPKG